MAGKVIQNNFTVDIQEEVSNVIAMLSDEQIKQVAELYLTKEAIKKQDEYRKNYSDVSRILPNSFANKLYERVFKQIMFKPVRESIATVTQLHPEANDQPVKKAARNQKNERSEQLQVEEACGEVTDQ